MKMTRLWGSSQKPTISFELFPPRSPKGAENLEKTIDELAALKPDFVSVTFGACGSTWHGLPARDNTARMAVPHRSWR